MAKSKSTTPAASPSFVGGYVTDLRDVLVASALSGQHAVVLGAPGWGKTAIARSLAKSIAGDGAWTFNRLDPSTPPEAVRGAYDPAALLNGQLSRVVTGTPYDVSARVSILDEVFRANDVVFDACLDVLDRMDANPDQAAVVWSTANFVARGERVEALIDRFGLWLWLQPDTLDVAALVGAQLSSVNGLNVSGGLPDWKDVESVRQARPGDKAKHAVAELLETLALEATAQGRRPHPRRVTQWSKLVYRLGVYDTGQADFSAVPDVASRALRWAWPMPASEEAESWAQIAAGVVDAVGSAIEGALAQAVVKFREVAGISDQAQRMGRMGELGALLANAQATLKQVGDDDPRVAEASARLTEWFAAAARGEMPNGNGH
ncbi:MAG TPA: AAA family ATPase [Anaerolineae bacterium]|nr:AAA family ATPase [Anaerolineae bacterium]